MKTQEIILILLKNALFGIKEKLPDNIDWDAVNTELKAQTVQALLCPISGELVNEYGCDKKMWLNIARSAAQSYFKILKNQQETVKLLNDNGIKCTVIKGTAAAMYYPYPEYRTMGDIDLLIEKGKAREAAELLMQNAYQLDIPLEKSARHYNLSKDGIEFEVHNHFSDFKNESLSEYLDEMLFSGMEDIYTATDYNYDFPVFDQINNGVILLCHINQHLSAGLGLRQVIDWIMYVSEILDDECWDKHFKNIAENLGLRKMAIVFAHIGQMYFGLTKENHTWCLSADETLCEEILELIFNSGNFGRKDQLNDLSKTLYSIKKENLFRRLQESGEQNFFDIIQKHPYLKPVIWIPQIFRYVGQGICMVYKNKDICKSIKESDKKISLMEQIGRQD